MVYQYSLCTIHSTPEVTGVADVKRDVLQYLCYYVCLPFALQNREAALDSLLLLFRFGVSCDVDKFVVGRAMNLTG